MHEDLSGAEIQRPGGPEDPRDGGSLDAAAGACHVWLALSATGAVVDFDAWEEPVRYDATDRPHGPWTAPRPDFYRFSPGEHPAGLHAVRPDRDATALVEQRLSGPAARQFIAAALADALQRLGGDEG